MAARVVRDAGAEATTPAIDIEAVKQKVKEGLDSFQEVIAKTFTQENVDVRNDHFIVIILNTKFIEYICVSPPKYYHTG